MKKLFKRFFIASCLFLLGGMVYGQSKEFVLTPNGVGSLVKDKPFVDCSKSNEGLYNKVVVHKIEDEMEGDYSIYDLFWNNEAVASFRLDAGVLDLSGEVSIKSTKIKTRENLGVGMLLSDVFKIPGTEAKWIVYMDSGGFSYIVCKEYRIEVGDNILSASGKNKTKKIIESGEIELLSSDFLPNVRVTGIAF